MASDQKSREPSYRLTNSEWVKATLFLGEAPRAGTCRVEVGEISRFGGKLLVAGPPELQPTCQVLLESVKLEQPLRIAAEMHWARPNPAGDWLLGCGFEPPIASDRFQMLLDSGLLERRSAVRRQARIAVEVQWRPNAPRIKAFVSDLSEGGVCLISPEPPESTRELSIYGRRSGQELIIPLKFRWSLRVGQSHFVGCEFAKRTDFVAVRSLQPMSKSHFRANASDAPIPLRTRLGL